MTFERPLSRQDFEDLDEIDGVSFETFEAIGEQADGTVITIGGGLDFLTTLGGDFEAAEAQERGIVSAEVLLDDSRAFHALAGSPEVFIVDLAAERLRQAIGADPALLRAAPSQLDVIHNDVYWLHRDPTDDRT